MVTKAKDRKNFAIAGNGVCIGKFARCHTGVTRKFAIIEFDSENVVRTQPFKEAWIALSKIRGSLNGMRRSLV